MDAVITYVNGNDPVWRKQYEDFAGHPIMAKRYRDWGTLKYLLRGIEKYMPYVGNVYLVVSGESQVPDWANTENLKVVTHEEFIPSEYLPTFNANPIEMNLHRIPGLDERFIYFNDDFFPVAPSSENDFFTPDGKIVIKPSKDIFCVNMFKRICLNSDRAARRASGRKAYSPYFLRPQHSCAPMLRSVCDEVYSSLKCEIAETSSHRTRTSEDLNQYLFTDYCFLTGKTVPGRLSNKHFSLASASVEQLEDFLGNPSKKFVCINDVKLSEKKEDQFREVILSSFDKMFPEKSKYEK